jgi:hypothetical protein
MSCRNAGGAASAQSDSTSWPPTPPRELRNAGRAASERRPFTNVGPDPELTYKQGEYTTLDHTTIPVRRGGLTQRLLNAARSTGAFGR